MLQLFACLSTFTAEGFMCWRTDEGIHMVEFYMSEAGLVPALALIRLNVIYQYEVELSVSNP